MAKMKIIKVKIQGRTPMLCNRFTDEAAENATNGASAASRAGERGSPKEQAEKSLYKSAQDGTLIIPQPNIFSCIIEAGKFHKNGRSKITTQKSSLIPACVEMDEIEYPIESKDGWDVDTRAVRIPATGGRILKHRAKFNDWAINFEIKLDTEIMSENLLRDIIDDAGSKIGLGDFRPDRKGPFGKFKVVNWEVSN